MSHVNYAQGDDPEMLAAFDQARATFKYFWREMAWERQRIVPALGLACVKVSVEDPPELKSDPEESAEHMWLDEVDFDGRTVSGILINTPMWLKSVKEGDKIATPLNEISDWMYAVRDKVYGAHTVNLLRSRMSPVERMQHDGAWGLDFGKPEQVELVPADWGKKKGLLGLLGKGKPSPDQEHPMAVNTAPGLREELEKDPSLVQTKDEQGWTLLHIHSLAGDISGVKVLLDLGSDPNALASNDMTPLMMARSLSWSDVEAALKLAGAD